METCVPVFIYSKSFVNQTRSWNVWYDFEYQRRHLWSLPNPFHSRNWITRSTKMARPVGNNEAVLQYRFRKYPLWQNFPANTKKAEHIASTITSLLQLPTGSCDLKIVQPLHILYGLSQKVDSLWEEYQFVIPYNLPGQNIHPDSIFSVREVFQRRNCHKRSQILGISSFDITEDGNPPDENIIDLSLL